MDPFAALGSTAVMAADALHSLKKSRQECDRLRAEVQALKTDIATYVGINTAHLEEVEALRADAERWRYINERNGEWRRSEADGSDPAYSMLCVRLPYDADLSCKATREIAIDAARAAQGDE